MSWYVYIVECSDKSLYTGITTDLERRVAEHNSKIGAKAVRGRLPVSLMYSERLNNRAEASKRETEVKRWSRKQKLGLIAKNSLRQTRGR